MQTHEVCVPSPITSREAQNSDQAMCDALFRSLPPRDKMFGQRVDTRAHESVQAKNSDVTKCLSRFVRSRPQLVVNESCSGAT